MNTAVTKLRYTQDFVDDLNEIVDYIALNLRNPDAAQKLADDIQAAIMERLKAPLAFEPYRSAITLSSVWYRIRVHSYTVFYVVEGDTMEVRRVLYYRRDWKSML